MTPEMRKLLDSLEPAIRKAFEEAIARLTSAAQIALLQDAIAAGDIPRALAVLQIGPGFFAPLDRAISEAFYLGGVAAITAIPTLKDPFPDSAWSLALMAAIHAQRNGSGSEPET